MVATTFTGAVLAAYDRLPDSEKRVADFILKGTSEASSLMATEVAKMSGTSNTTVSRFVRALGYDSYAEMRIALAREEAANAAEGKGSVMDGSVLEDPEAFVEFVAAQKEREIEDTKAQLDLGALMAVVDLIRGSQMVLVVGVGTSLAFAQMFAIKLSHAGVRAVAPASLDSAMSLAPTLTSKDCIVLASNSGRQLRLQAIINIAVDEAVPTAAITSNAASPLAESADYVLTACVRDQMLDDDVVLSHNSLNFVAEVIVQLILHSDDFASESLRQFSRTMRRARKG